MSLMEEWAKLFPNAKPRSNPNDVAGEDWVGFDSLLSPFRGADGWQYDPWDEDTMYPLKGVDSELGWMAAQMNNAQYLTNLEGGWHNTGTDIWNYMGSFEYRNWQAKSSYFKSIGNGVLSGKATKGNYRGMSWWQIYGGIQRSEAGLQEYNSITLDEFKAL